jgi:mannose-6-phosphate isomerase
MSDLPLLRFKPILRDYVWGGRRLAELGKPLGDGDHHAESWEVVDHGGDQSIVADGPLARQTLHDLVTQHGPALFGRHHPQKQFPLLFKFLDCHQTLSVQVHPNDDQAAKLDPPDLGKTEAWVVLAAEPGSRIYAGLRPGVDRTALQTALESGRCEDCLHHFEPKVGDCLLIKAGTVHALGAGLLVAEIQQASDTTFRLFDWNRADHRGNPRPLHINQALETIDYSRGPVNPVKRQPANSHIERLVGCDKFILNRFRLGATRPLANDNRFHILAVIDGNVTIQSNSCRCPLRRGDTLLIPASCERIELAPVGSATVLDAHLP